MTMTTTAPATAMLAGRDDVLSLVRRIPPLTTPPVGRIAVRLPGLSDVERVRTELRLNAALRECGCSLGSTAMSAAALAYVTHLWLTLGSPLRAGGGDVVAGGVVVGAAAVLGKVAGIVSARLRLRRHLYRLAEPEVVHHQHGGS